MHLRINPALDEALVDLLAVPGPVRLRAQRAAAVLAENSFATLVINPIYHSDYNQNEEEYEEEEE